MKVFGVDEAGRGAVLGPLVLCGAVIDEEKIQDLRDIGVKDSKLLSPKKRMELSIQLEPILDAFEIIRISPKEIDESRRSGTNLNDLEAMKMADLINNLKPEKAYVDAVDSDTEKFKTRLKKYLRVDTELIAEHGADKTYPIVSAASILAKVARDQEIENLKSVYGEIGSGYPSDPVTKSFLTNWLKESKTLPEIVRETWATVSDAIESQEQTNLDKWSK